MVKLSFNSLSLVAVALAGSHLVVNALDAFISEPMKANLKEANITPQCKSLSNPFINRMLLCYGNSP